MGIEPILKGVSQSREGDEAVAEILFRWSEEERQAIQLLLVYHSSEQDATRVAQTIHQLLPGVKAVGCTTAGEILDGLRYDGSLVMMAFTTPKIRWSIGLIPDVNRFVTTDARALIHDLTVGLGLEHTVLQADRNFCIVLQDGLAMKEEQVTAALALELGSGEKDGVVLVGGSAGDDLWFENTWQLINGSAHRGAAVVILGDSDIPFRPFKHQYYVPVAGQEFVVTEADYNERRVYSLDGEPAAEVYARAIAMPVEELSSSTYGQSPLIYQEMGNPYVRSIQRVESDHSMIFYCGIETGALLDLGQQHSPNEMLAADLERLRQELGEISVMLLFSCILCKVDQQGGGSLTWSGRLQQVAPHVIGFDTYGEQFNGLHINQTLTALAFGAIA